MKAGNITAICCARLATCRLNEGIPVQSTDADGVQTSNEVTGKLWVKTARVMAIDPS